MFKTITDDQQVILSEIKELKSRLEAIEKAVHSFGMRLVNLQGNVQTLQLTALAIEGISTSMEAMQETLKSQQAKLVNLEDRSRRSNLVIFGITAQPKETICFA